ncbi:hypothetical protein HDU79_006692 [Rhizoclosmatium sp. JEL0117]|nr:hypothetical protein HDU79_006692 [Rhizoclosmatium sp. JEL0117]
MTNDRRDPPVCLDKCIAGNVYTEGMKCSFDGQNWLAQWWTNTLPSADQKVWANQGSCSFSGSVAGSNGSSSGGGVSSTGGSGSGSGAAATTSVAAAGEISDGNTNSGSASNTGAVVGGVVGALCAVLIIGGALIWTRRRKAKELREFNETRHFGSPISAVGRNLDGPRPMDREFMVARRVTVRGNRGGEDIVINVIPPIPNEDMTIAAAPELNAFGPDRKDGWVVEDGRVYPDDSDDEDYSQDRINTTAQDISEVQDISGYHKEGSIVVVEGDKAHALAGHSAVSKEVDDLAFLNDREMRHTLDRVASKRARLNTRLFSIYSEDSGATTEDPHPTSSDDSDLDDER